MVGRTITFPHLNFGIGYIDGMVLFHPDADCYREAFIHIRNLNGFSSTRQLEPCISARAYRNILSIFGANAPGWLRIDCTGRSLSTWLLGDIQTPVLFPGCEYRDSFTGIVMTPAPWAIDQSVYSIFTRQDSCNTVMCSIDDSIWYPMHQLMLTGCPDRRISRSYSQIIQAEAFRHPQEGARRDRQLLRSTDDEEYIPNTNRKTFFTQY